MAGARMAFAGGAQTARDAPVPTRDESDRDDRLDQRRQSIFGEKRERKSVDSDATPKMPNLLLRRTAQMQKKELDQVSSPRMSVQTHSGTSRPDVAVRGTKFIRGVDTWDFQERMSIDERGIRAGIIDEESSPSPTNVWKQGFKRQSTFGRNNDHNERKALTVQHKEHQVIDRQLGGSTWKKGQEQLEAHEREHEVTTPGQVEQKQAAGPSGSGIAQAIGILPIAEEGGKERNPAFESLSKSPKTKATFFKDLARKYSEKEKAVPTSKTWIKRVENTAKGKVSIKPDSRFKRNWIRVAFLW